MLVSLSRLFSSAALINAAIPTGPHGISLESSRLASSSFSRGCCEMGDRGRLSSKVTTVIGTGLGAELLCPLPGACTLSPSPLDPVSPVIPFDPFAPCDALKPNAALSRA